MTYSNGVQTSALQEIHDVNLSYLLLAQRLLRENRAVGLYRTGLSEEAGEVLANLSLQQTVSLASSNVLLCGFRINDASLLAALGKSSMNSALNQVRMTMAMSQRPVIEPENVAI